MGRTLSSLLSLMVLIAPASNAWAADSELKIGYLLDLSAKAAFIGVQSQAGAELAVRELRARGISIAVLYEDHRTDAKSSVAATRKLLDVDGVDAVLCDTTPGCSAASPIVATAKKLFLYQSPAVSILTSNPYGFKNFLDYAQGCREVARYWKKQGIERVANLKVQAEFGQLCFDAVSESYPHQVELAYDTGTDLRALVTKAKSLGIQAFFQTGYEADYISHFRAASDLSMLVPTGFPAPLLTHAVLSAVAPTVLENSVVFGFRPVSEEFVARLKASGLFRSDASIESAAIAYLHVQQAAFAVMECKGRGIDCEVERVRDARLDSPLGFKGWKDRVAQYDYLLSIWRDGRLEELR